MRLVPARPRPTRTRRRLTVAVAGAVAVSLAAVSPASGGTAGTTGSLSAVPAAVPAAPAAVAAAPAAAVPASTSGAACDPFTRPAYRGQVPTAKSVIGIDLGERDVTTDEAYRYLDAVDAASPRVVSGSFGRSAAGRPLRYAVVGQPRHVSERGLAAVVAANKRIRDPRTPAAVARRLAERTPAIFFYAANVHGNEESGTDAALRIAYDLADRSDCAARAILDNAVVVVVPTQNPDGREADARRNYYGFDLNRDWFARTQTETDDKVELLRRFPSVLFIDAHEMGRATYFFPPNADPIYHEITDEAVGWINDLYGASMQREFGRQGIPYFNRDVYDLFYMGYGDTVPTTGFIAAGMTFEKANGDPTQRRVQEQYVAGWTSLSAGARDKVRVLRQWHAAYAEALRQGRAGRLEPNQVENPGNEVRIQVPTDPVRHYFLREDEAGKRPEVRALVRRLQRMDVEVRRLTRPLRVPDFRAYGERARSVTLPAGTFWVPMAQRQKHWVQAMLNEDTYTPFPYFYDVTAWSQPLLFNVAGGRSGSAALRPRSALVPPVPDTVAPRVPGRTPRVGVLQLGSTSSAVESTGWLRWLFEQRWRLPYRSLTAADVAAGRLDGVDVLVAPNGSLTEAEAALGDAGKAALQGWVRGGGRYVGFRAGTALAARLGLTTATVAAPTSDVPGSLLRVDVDRRSPLARGVGASAWNFYEYDVVLRPADPATAPVRYPALDSGRFFVSGFAEGEEELAGTAAVVDERAGDGRVVLFAGDPNYRAFTTGTQKLLRNALFGRNPAVRAGGSPAAAERAAEVAADVEIDTEALVVTVRAAAAERAQAALDRRGARYERRDRGAAGTVAFVVANPGGAAADEHPWALDLARDLRDLGRDVVAVRLP